MKKFIALLMILSTPAFADPVHAIKVHTGDIVTPQYDQGTLLDAPQATKLTNQLIDADACTKENESFQKSVDLYKANQVIYNQENSLLLSRNVELSKTLNEAKSTSNWEKVGYFALGIAATSLAIYGAKQLVNK
jgi:hypothetical protein